MNRIKKEFRAKGWQLENDQEMLPTPGGLHAIVVDSEKATITMVHTSISVQYGMNRAGEVVEIKYW